MSKKYFESQITVQGSVNISKWKDTPIKKILSNYDKNKDGILSKEDGILSTDELDKIRANPQKVAEKKTPTTKPNTIFRYTRFHEQGTLQEYDEKGNLIKEVNDHKGKPKSIQTFEYDKNDRMTKKTVDYDCDGDPEETTWFEYDEKGNVTEYTHRVIKIDLDMQRWWRG